MIKSNLNTIVIAMIAALGAWACEGGESPEGGETAAMTPFSISAVVEGATVDEVTSALAEYIQNIDDTEMGLQDDWVVAGANMLAQDAHPSEAALHLPGGGRIVEVCNHYYAGAAMSFGGHHGVALPCEISVMERDGVVEVVMLEPAAIFGVFFMDVPADQAAGMSGLAEAVQGELRGLIEASLAEFDAEFPSTPIGPAMEPEALAEIAGLEYAVVMDMEIPESFTGDDEARQEFRAFYVEELLATLTYDGMDHVGSEVEGLSVTDWKSARPYALSLPGQVSVVEVCSPTYASAALSAGSYHAPALPCQIAIWVEGDTLRIHLLDPGFIFPVFFSDAPQEMMESMGGMVQAVRGDLQLIVAAAQDSMTIAAE